MAAERSASPAPSEKASTTKSRTFKNPSVEDGEHLFKVETHDIYDGAEDAVDPVYQAKARILNAAFQEIGMGKYQVRRKHTRVSD